MSLNESVLGKTFFAQNVTNLTSQAVNHLVEHGTRYESEKGEVVMMPRASLVLLDPKQRSLNIPGRVSNIYQLVAETLWVMSAGSKVDNFLSMFLPRATLYADDGVSWRGAYGDRLFKKDKNGISKIDDIVEMISKSPITRQAYVSIFDSERDLPQGLLKEGITKPKDVPCNVAMNFWVMPGTTELHLEVNQRSGDIFWGTGSINLFEFSTILEVVLVAVNKKLVAKGEQPLTLGTYRQNITNLHYYTGNIGEQANAVNENFKAGLCNGDHVLDSGEFIFNDISHISKICNEFIDFIEDMNNNHDQYSDNEFRETQFNFMYKVGLKLEENTKNTLYVYLKLIEQYTTFKNFGVNAPGFSVDLFEHHPSLLKAVRDCKFTKFII